MPLPARGPAVRELGLTLPPASMPVMQAWRPLKGWRYVGVYGPEVQLCVGIAKIGPIPTRWWAIAEPGQSLREGSRGIALEYGAVHVKQGGVELDLELDEAEPVETATAYGKTFAWTAKQADIPARGLLTIDGREVEIESRAMIDVSAGYHPRHTQWKWSAGVGRTDDGRSIGWNLVTGIHDSPENSERSVWVDGEPVELPPVQFDGLEAMRFASGERLDFSAWSERRDRTNVLVMRNYYRQPFGTFSGSLPGGLRLAEGYGVMEEHDVWW